MNGAIPPLLLYVFMAWTGKTFLLPHYYYYYYATDVGEVGKCEGKIRLWRPLPSCEDNIKMDLKEIE
jgi:hypothetical protein